MNATIYGLCDPWTGHLRYVGVTRTTPEKRLAEHLKSCKGNTHRERWIASLVRKHLAPDLFVLETISSEYAANAEQFWIAYFRSLGSSLVNATAGGEGLVGPSPETRAKLSAPKSQAHLKAIADARLGRPGTRWSAITRERMIASRATSKVFGKFTPEHRAKIGASHRGKTITQEHRAKLSAAMSGRPQPWNRRKASQETRAKLSVAAIRRCARWAEAPSPYCCRKCGGSEFKRWPSRNQRYCPPCERKNRQVWRERYRASQGLRGAFGGSAELTR